MYHLRIEGNNTHNSWDTSLQQTHTQLTFHCCEGDSQWITSDGGLSHTHCYNLCSVHGVSSKTTHTQHISRVVACGCQCGAVIWADSDLVMKGTLLETCLPVVHLECGGRCGCSDSFSQCRRIGMVWKIRSTSRVVCCTLLDRHTDRYTWS